MAISRTSGATPRTRKLHETGKTGSDSKPQAPVKTSTETEARVTEPSNPTPRPTAATRAFARNAMAARGQLFRAALERGPEPFGGNPRNERRAFSLGGDPSLTDRAQDTGKFGDSPATREVLRNPPDVNQPGSPEAIAQAETELANRAVDEQTQLDSMTEEAQAQYAAIRDQTAADPLARRDLQSMLLEGDFDGPEGRALLAELGELSTMELADGLDRGALVSDLVQELHDPAAIDQGARGTCAPTTAMIYAAETDPATYARLVKELASPEGVATLANGDQIQREPGTLQDDGSTRTQSARLLAPALMEYANGSANYDNTQDRHERNILGFEIGQGSGLTSRQFDRVIEGMTGRTYEDATAGSAAARAELAERIIEAANNGEMIPAGLHWSDDSGHKVLITGGDDDFVYYINPWGQEERMSREEFEMRAKNASFPQG